MRVRRIERHILLCLFFYLHLNGVKAFRNTLAQGRKMMDWTKLRSSSANLESALPESLCSTENIRTVVKSEVLDLMERIDEAFEHKDSHPPNTIQRFSLNSLLKEKENGGGPVHDALCEALALDHYVVVSLTEEKQQAIKTMWASLENFFGLDEETKRSKGGEFSNVDGAVGIVGYNVMPDGNEFLETRLWPNGTICPTLNSAVSGFDNSILAARASLAEVGITVVTAALGSLGIAYSSVADLIDDDHHSSLNKEAPVLSATQHRFCRYTSSQSVSFGAHTDTTFATIIPCSNIAGLEVYTRRNGWVRPELCCQPGQDVLVLAGELLQIFTTQRFPAAVHRVLKAPSPPDGATPSPRLSAPLLLRPQPSKKLDSKAWLQTQYATKRSLKELDGIVEARFKMLDRLSMGDLHQYLVDAFRNS